MTNILSSKLSGSIPVITNLYDWAHSAASSRRKT